MNADTGCNALIPLEAFHRHVAMIALALATAPREPNESAVTLDGEAP